MSLDDKIKKIEALKKDIYSKEYKEQEIIQDHTMKREYDVQDSWSVGGKSAGAMGNPTSPEKTDFMAREKKKTKTLTSILVFSVIFFVVALLFAVYQFYSGGNVVSDDKVQISVVGPLATKGGDVLPFTVKISNENDAAIESASLIIEYPTGAYSVDLKEGLNRTKTEIKDIKSYQIATEDFEAVLFGEENAEKEITLRLEYRFEDSNAVLQKEETYIVKLTSSPINLSIDTLGEVTSGQEFEMVLEVSSNSSNTLENLLVDVEYPSGFEFKSASPAPLYGISTWKVGDLPPSDSFTIRIRGVLEGENEEAKVFRYSVGTRSEKDERIIGIVYNTTSEEILIKQPFLGLELFVGGENVPVHSAPGGAPIYATIKWSSNIPTAIIDTQIEVKMSGSILDRYSVSAGREGFFKSSENVLLWSKESGMDSLGVVDPGESGVVSFNFSPKPLVPGEVALYKDPEITLEVSVKGRRLSDVNVPEEIKTFISRKIRVESEAKLTSRLVHFVGPFQNTGPMPPRAEQKTTYTVIWSITNTTNDVSAAVVKASLPIYVDWLGVVSPQDQNISFNEIGNEVVWNIGDIPAGTGFTSPAKEVAFQISFEPSITQIKGTPAIISQTSLSANDDFTGTLLQSVSPELDTRLTTDPGFISDYGRVAE